ncbi:MAG: NAD(+) diphosphatase [Terracoccus sp.]
MTADREPLHDLALSRATLDRGGLERRDPDLLSRLLADPGTRVLDLRDLEVPVSTDGDDYAIVLRPPAPADSAHLVVHLGRDGHGTAYLAVIAPRPAGDVDSTEGESGHRGEWVTLRQAGAALGDRDAGLFTTALALANWHASHQHCPRCGARTEPVQAGWVRRCPADASEHYPRTDPAVIMSVVDGDDRLLLGRGATWPEGRFSVLAGFVESGESLEAAVAREVAEEVGIAVDEVVYLGNQPWPFPSSLMVGFAATTREVELTLDPAEIAEARWVSREDYRRLLREGSMQTPSGISIARRIIERWLGGSVEDENPAAW